VPHVDVAGERFFVETAGRGAPLLMVHGFPLDHSMWRAQIDHFAASHQVVAVDLRGFGQSVVTPGKVSMAQLADDCRGILDALEIEEPVTFCGLSMGGYVGWQFARKYPARLRRLIQCDTRAIADTAEAAAGRMKLAEHVLAAGTGPVSQAMLPKLIAPGTRERRPDVVEALRAMIAAAPPAGVAAALHCLAERPDVTGWLADIRVPALLIVGAQDAISPPEEMRSIAAALPDARLVVIPEAGHMAPMENPAAVNQAMAEFLGVPS
jgi:3-oxoadipate enol-lactonase